MNFKVQISLFLLGIAVSFSNFCFADHYLGGYISYSSVNDSTFTIKVHTITDEELVAGDRDSIEVNLGNNDKEIFYRTNNNGFGEVLYDGIQLNIYEKNYTYSEYGNFPITFSDIFRTNDIKNMLRGASAKTNLYLSSILPIDDFTIYCKNNSPEPTSFPSLIYRTGDEVSFNFGLYDVDGDSLTYELVPIRGINGEDASGYRIPSGVTINPITGDFYWSSMPRGDYGYSIKVNEYREGELIAYHFYDFTLRGNSITPKIATITASQKSVIFNTLGDETTITIEANKLETDSSWISLTGSISKIPAFDLKLDTVNTDSNLFNGSVTIKYNQTHSFDGIQNLAVRYHYKIDDHIYYTDKNINIRSPKTTNWDCEVKDIENLFELIPEIEVFSPSENIFSESFWLNIGSDPVGLTVEFYDIRGRIVRRFENIDQSTFKIETSNLRPAIYVLIIYRFDEVRLVQKMIKY